MSQLNDYTDYNYGGLDAELGRLHTDYSDVQRQRYGNLDLGYSDLGSAYSDLDLISNNHYPGGAPYDQVHTYGYREPSAYPGGGYHNNQRSHPASYMDTLLNAYNSYYPQSFAGNYGYHGDTSRLYGDTNLRHGKVRTQVVTGSK